MSDIISDFIASILGQFFKGKVGDSITNQVQQAVEKAKERQATNPIFASDRTANADPAATSAQQAPSASPANAWRPDAITTGDANWHPGAASKGDDAWNPNATAKRNDPWHPDSGSKKNDPWHPGD